MGLRSKQEKGLGIQFPLSLRRLLRFSTSFLISVVLVQLEILFGLFQVGVVGECSSKDGAVVVDE